MTSLPVPRWAISMADLALLLLAVFVLLHAADSQAVKIAARTSFGGALVHGKLFDESASRLFERGEARMTPEGRSIARKIGAAAGKRGLVVESQGRDASVGRFDGWELAAARAAALARALVEAGLVEDQVAITIPSNDTAKSASGQRLTVRLSD